MTKYGWVNTHSTYNSTYSSRTSLVFQKPYLGAFQIQVNSSFIYNFHVESNGARLFILIGRPDMPLITLIYNTIILIKQYYKIM
jgi:hypothetical protein